MQGVKLPSRIPADVLLLCQAALLLIALVSPNGNDSNRVGAMASIILSGLLVILVSAVAPGRRILIAMDSVMIGVLAGVVGFGLLSIDEVRWYGDVTVRMWREWPTAGDNIRTSLLGVLGLTGYVAGNTLGFLLIPAALASICLLSALNVTVVRVGLVAAAALAIAMILMTTSRAAIFGLAIGLVFCGLTWRQGRLRELSVRLMPLLTAAVVLLIAAVEFRDRSMAGRLAIWGSAIERLGGSPVLGIGYGAYAAETGTNTHSTLLEWATDFGLVGLAIAATTVAFTYLVAAKAATAPKDDMSRLGQITSVSLVALVVPGLTESVFALALPFDVGMVTLVNPFIFLILAATSRPATIVRHLRPRSHTSAGARRGS